MGFVSLPIMTEFLKRVGLLLKKSLPGPFCICMNWRAGIQPACIFRSVDTGARLLLLILLVVAVSALAMVIGL